MQAELIRKVRAQCLAQGPRLVGGDVESRARNEQHPVAVGAQVNWVGAQPVPGARLQPGGERAEGASRQRGLAEAGLPAFDRYTWFGMFAPAGTPPEVVRRLQTEVAAALKAPDLRERFEAVGAEPVGSTPEQFVERIRSDSVKWSEVIKAGNVKVQ